MIDIVSRYEYEELPLLELVCGHFHLHRNDHSSALALTYFQKWDSMYAKNIYLLLKIAILQRGNTSVAEKTFAKVRHID